MLIIRLHHCMVSCGEGGIAPRFEWVGRHGGFVLTAPRVGDAWRVLSCHVLITPRFVNGMRKEWRSQHISNRRWAVAYYPSAPLHGLLRVGWYCAAYRLHRVSLTRLIKRVLQQSKGMRKECYSLLPRATHSTDCAQPSSIVTPRSKLCPPPRTFRVNVRARRCMSEKQRQE